MKNAVIAIALAIVPLAPAAFADESANVVQQGSFSAPAWIISQPKNEQRPPELIVGNLPLAASPFYYAAPGLTGSGSPCGYGWSGGIGAPYGGWGTGIPGATTYGYSGLSGLGWGGYAVPYIGGGGFGLGRFGLGRLGLGGFGIPSLGGFGIPSFGWGGGIGRLGGLGLSLGLGALGGGWGGYGLGGLGGWGYGGGAFGGLPQSGRLSSTRVIQTGPSPAAGNYYAPASVDPSAAGNYYAQTGTAAFPVSQPASQAKDYWGSNGSPFPKDINSTPWSK